MASIFEPSEEKTNGTKLARLLIDVGTPALRNVLESFIHPPLTLKIMLKNNKRTLDDLKNKKRVLNGNQWEKLFPPSGDPPDSKTFDIILLHLLLRNICPALKKPSTGWHEMPADTDHSREAEIVRIKYFRNSVSHNFSTGVPNDEFEDKWNTISHSLVALGVDQLEINCLKTQDIDHGTQRRIDEEVEKWKLDIEPRVQTLEHKVEQIESRISSNQQHISAPLVTRKLPNCLPDEVHHVFGRSEEIKRAVEAVQSGTVSIVSLTGGPGFGKTTVANKVAHELAKRENSRSVLFCPLTYEPSLDDVFTEMILTCSASPSQLPENPKRWLLNWSKQQSGKVTLILDNADRVLESEDRHQFVDTLRKMRTLSRQNLTFVTTSRKTVDVPSCGSNIQNIRLNSLSSPDAINVLVSRARDSETRQKLSQSEKIVSLCGCVPLALRIAGSLLSHCEEDKLIEKLANQPLDVLQDNNDSVDKTIKTSFDFLSEAERKGLTIMSVFPGPFDSDATEAVLPAVMDSEIQPVLILQSLQNRCLLEQPSSCRYEIHQLIKMFLSKHCHTKYSEAVAQGKEVACAHYMSRLAENADRYWGKDTCKQSLDSFNKDRHNFEHYLQQRGSEGYVAMKSCEAFFDNLHQKCMYLEMCVHPRFYTHFLQELLTVNATEINPVRKVELLCLLGREERKVRHTEKYKNYMEEAYKLYSKNKTKFEKYVMSEITFLNGYARFLSDEKMPTTCKEVCDDALRICEQKLCNHFERGAALMVAGREDKHCRRFTEAEKKFSEALNLLKECLGEHLMTAKCFKFIADLKLNDGKGSLAVKSYKESLEMMEHLGMDGHKETILLLKNYGSCQMSNGNYEEARALLEKAELVAERELVEDHMWKVRVKTELAILFHKERKEDQMIEAMKNGLEMCYRLENTVEELGNKREIRKVLNGHPEKFPKDKYPR
ncbi:uncharacterized protein LOC111344812 [Stylophora pistillata]|uniref:uncharacterized protein LOC111344812 n=1 Tax=Stylophora pistillata TaxID=50429 RepID=UPI000C050259|nr:uncharacterized protein LOC111344812 [Stylophora pistillata]